MSEEMRLRLIAELNQAIDQFVDSIEFSDERKVQVLRELLVMAVEEDSNDHS